MTSYRPIRVWAELASYVAAILIQEDDDPGPPPPQAMGVPARVLPTPLAVLGFQIRGRLTVIRDGAHPGCRQERLLDRSGISVLQSTARHFRPAHGTQSVLVMLHPAAAFSLVRWPMYELADQHVGLADLLGVRTVRAIEGRLAEARTTTERATVVQRSLLDLFAWSETFPHPVVTEATRRIMDTSGRLRLRPLSDDLAISERQLERLFREQIGTSPKQFASLVQFDWAWQRIGRGLPLSALASEAGYADQAHLTRAFVARTGLPPMRLLADAPSR